MTTRTLGLARRRPITRDRWLLERPYVGRATSLETVMQPLASLHDQRRKPSCVGQAHAQGIEAFVGYRVSAVDLWEGARILQGSAQDAAAGTRGEYAIEWLERHGWGDYVPGEDTRPQSDDRDTKTGGTLAGAMRAAQRSGRILRHQTIDTRRPITEVVRQVVGALAAGGVYVVLEGGTTPAYQQPPPDTVLGTTHRAGDSGGHAERIVGWSAGREAFILQGSWGAWTWCHLPDGERAMGCCLVSPAVVARAWAIDVVRVAE